jgi:hypothetical protein
MLKFLEIKEPKTTFPSKMSTEEYIEFCEFCIKNNPHITPENCLHYHADEQQVKVPFHF